MKRWILTYELQSEFSVPVTNHFYTLRCIPRDMDSQRVEKFLYKIEPFSGADFGEDSFGNRILTGAYRNAHDRFSLWMTAVVLTEDQPEEEGYPLSRLGMFRYGTRLTCAGERLEEFYQRISPAKEKDAWSKALEMQEALWENFRYQKGITDIHTTAEEAFLLGAGVCQDYAHILLALCRRDGITVRYVAGAIPGEGESHAWVEVYQDGFWKGFDPTNHCVAGDDYIRLCIGRDADDCPLNRGIFCGNASQKQEVRIRMEEN